MLSVWVYSFHVLLLPCSQGDKAMRGQNEASRAGIGDGVRSLVHILLGLI